MPEHSLSPHLHEKYTKDLLATMRRIDSLEAEKKECASFINDVVKTETSRESMLRDLLEGRVSEQVALPGLEAPEGRAREIGARLRLAVEKVELLCNVDREAGLVNVVDEDKRRRGGIDSVTLRVGDKEVTATPGQLRAGLAELDRRKKARDGLVTTDVGAATEHLGPDRGAHLAPREGRPDPR
jgi:hypothetical protein